VNNITSNDGEEKTIVFPRRPRGRPNGAAQERYEKQRRAFCRAILKINSKDYIARYGVRKVEANALVVDPLAGRLLCRAAILKYVDPNRIPEYHAAIEPKQEEMAAALWRLLAERGAAR
jgi:hypothetical protein